MKTPGITVRPLRQITGEAEFNEVFFDNVRVPVENLVGKLNEGWSVAITTLAYERDLLTFIRHISLRNALHRLVRLVAGAEDRAPTRSSARSSPPSGSASRRCSSTATGASPRSCAAARPGPRARPRSSSGASSTRSWRTSPPRCIGPYSQIADGSPWAPDDGQWEFYELLARASGIRAGTSEILRNILAERVLGLPKD